MLDHFGPIVVLGLAGALLGWAMVVMTSRIEHRRRERHADVFGDFHGLKICDTSISTRAMAPNGASGWPVEASQAEADGTVAQPPAHAPIGHPPLDQGDLSIPAFLRRTNLH
jgi:hypothetical protein